MFKLDIFFFMNKVSNIFLIFKIIIHVFQMDINCILMKYYFYVYDHDSCISKGH